MTVRKIPEGYHSVTPYIVVKGAAKALDFYARAFGAKEKLGCRWATSSGTPRS